MPLNYTPINPIEMAEKTGLTLDEVMEFFDKEFGGLDKYVEACADRAKLEGHLERMYQEVIQPEEKTNE